MALFVPFFSKVKSKVCLKAVVSVFLCALCGFARDKIQLSIFIFLANVSIYY